jgi:hypothetical protein
MSIYAVPLYKWFAKDKDHASTCRRILECNHCTMCGGKCNFKTAIADHSLPWGCYRDVFCTQRCEKEYNKLVRG